MLTCSAFSLVGCVEIWASQGCVVDRIKIKQKFYTKNGVGTIMGR
jgi:hypothetical protein